MAIVAALLFASVSAEAQLFSSAQQTPHPAVVRVIAAEPGGASLGSGTLVDVNSEHGLVITNWHVVRDAPASVLVVFPDGFQSTGRVLRMDSNWDLAAILIQKPRAAPVRLARDAPRVGEMLTIAGYGSGSYRAAAGPCTQYLAPSTQHPYELVELAASARQGDSGGPIFNGNGELAGVLFGEGGGRTTGAYCGRVHNFLTLAVRQLHEQNGTALAAVPTDRPPSPSGGAPVDGGAWRQKLAATPRDSEYFSVASAAPLAAGGDEASSATFYSGTVAQRETSSQLPPPAAVAPLAAIAANAATESAKQADSTTHKNNYPAAAKQFTSGQTTINSPARTADSEPSSVAEVPSPSPLWQVLAGDTLIAQIKTVLAGLGVLALLFHGGRALARSGKSTSRRSPKRA